MARRESGKYEIKVSVKFGDDSFDFRVYVDEYLTNFNAHEMKRAINNIIRILDKGEWQYASNREF